VDVHAADADAIAHAVLRCPTGALHFVRHDEGAQETPDAPTTLTPIRNGPLYVRGDLEIRGLDGRTIRTGTRASLCRCGLARQIPFCDNTCRQEHWREPSEAAASAGPTGGPESAPPSAH
jgi:CDGSH-type Zn-finger protein